MLMCLPALMVGCQNDDIEDPVNPDPEIPGENASNYVEFKGNMMNFTRTTNVNEATATEARLYAWTRDEREVSYKKQLGLTQWTTVKNSTNQVYFTNPNGEYPIVPHYTIMTRNMDDPTMWDYKDKISWSMFHNNPGSFLAVVEPEGCMYGLEFCKNYLWDKKPVEISRTVPEVEYDDMNDEYYYSSGDLSDIMVAYTHDCTAEEYEGKKEVELNFRHVYPRVVLNGRVDDSKSLEVTVKEAYIYGLQTQGTFRLDRNSTYDEGWERGKNPLSQYVQMDISSPLKMTSELQPLVDKGHEPHVIPQKVKGWTSASSQDGAGIIMLVNIRSTTDNSWIVGAENEYEYVYAPFPLESLQSGRVYNIDILFGALYRDNGTAYGYQLSYQPQIVDWDVESENVELKK